MARMWADEGLGKGLGEGLIYYSTEGPQHLIRDKKMIFLRTGSNHGRIQKLTAG